MKPLARKGILSRRLAQLDALLAEDGLAPAIPGIPRRPKGATPPLSAGEEQLWFLAQLEPEDPAYNMPFVLRLRGALDRPALAAALARLVARHEVLRQVYPTKAALAAPPALPVVDLSSLPVPEKEAMRLAREDAARPFALERGPLLRATLLALAPGEHRLLLNLHHIVADGGSVAILFRELPALYRGASLPKPALQHGDFAHWQREWLQGSEAAALRAWWRERLDGLAAQELPADRTAVSAPTSRGGFVLLALDTPRSEALRRTGREGSATLFMVLLAAYQTLLHRWSGQTDIAPGGPVSGRGRPELENVVGLLVNMVVLRSDLSGDPTFRELLARSREAALGAFAHGELPFETLVQELRPDRRLSRNPLFRAVLVVKEPAPIVVQEGGLTWELEEVLTGAAKFDLELELEEGPEGIRGRLWYARDLFDGTTADRLAGHALELLAGLAADPGRRLSDLPLLSAAERRQLTVEWTGTCTAYPRDRGIHQLFAEQAARTPEAAALVFLGQRLSYRELDERANGVARRLAELGIGVESRVGVFAERSPDMVIGTLGILKAGAAYVPLDVQYPRERLAWMLEDAGLAAVLVQGHLFERLPDGAPRPLRLEEMAAAGAGSLSDAWAGPDSAAYVMYTSGSTGRPKGVVVTHRNVVRLVKETGFARFDERQVFLQLAPIAFDAATLEIWGPLLNGGRLVVFDPAPPSLDELGRTLEREGVTTLWLTAGLFHRMVDERLASLAGVEQLLAGGDVLSPAHVARALAALPGTRLINGYGPTENTTFTCCHPVSERPAGTVPIGRPIANTWIHVVDRSLQPVAVGVPGELLAGGDGLARGYLGRPGLTAERFVPDPFSSEPGARLYRSGDLVRRRPDGTVEFLGRIDGQVKIRGFRIEPGEVEQALGNHQAVAACAVVVREDAPGDKRLVAYLVPASVVDAPAPAELRAFLERTLPAPMVPSAFIMLRSLPLTPNGKVDRRALPAPGAGESAAGSFVAPRTAVEERLAAIWAEVLGVERVGVEEDFFALGGHSLKMMQIASRLRDAFGAELPLRALYETPTVAGMAAWLERELAASRKDGSPALCRLHRPEVIPLSSAQRRLWFLDQLEPGRATYNVPLALRLEGPLDVIALEAALGEIVRRHETLRTSFPVQDGEPFQAIAAPVPFTLPRIDLSGLPEPALRAEAERIAAAEAREPFDLANGPVLRLRLLRLRMEEHELIAVLHHIAADGWSVGVLVRELESLYAGKRLPDLPLQYADVVLWQNERLRGEQVERQVDWWRERLAGAPVLDLATDHPRPAAPRQRGAERSRALPRGLAGAVRALASLEGATLFTAALASLQALLFRHTRQADLTVGTPVANRGSSELEGLIGFFANTLVLRGRTGGDPPFRRLLAAARDEVLAAQSHQDAPFERLVEALQPGRDLGRPPLFQVMLTVESGGAAPALAGLKTSLRVLDAGVAKFDLGFTLLEEAGGARAAIEYDVELFDPSTIDRLLGHWTNLLVGAAAEPETPVSRLPLMGEAERHQILVEWNAQAFLEASPRREDATLHGLFEAQAARTPDAVALVCGDVELTYAELDRRASRLAARLARLGAGPETRVGILMRRSADLTAGLLGILKTGAAYVPLDPAYPVRRLELMLEDAAPAAVLAESSLLGLLPPGPFAVLCLNEVAAEEHEAFPGGAVEPESLAYLIYTSGSTGRPKGVAITHRSATALLLWARDLFPPEALTGVLAGTSVCFDLSVFEIFVPLAWGGRVFLVEDALALASLPRAGEVTLVNTVPSAMTELVRLGAVPASVEVVNLAGEPLHNALVQQVYNLGVRRLYNLYGPSEDTTYSTGRLKQKGANRVPTIGRPLPGTRAYVVDAGSEPVPMGSPGELLLGGVGLARGYLRRPDLTAEKFVPDPLSGTPGARLYRTGDLVRALADGNLMFLGRIDHQVKVRGFRIELGDIESALRGHPRVEQSVVVALQEAGGPALAAYVSPPIPSSELRRFLQERLPDYMVPSCFVGLEALPLTPNGKVDRKALPAPAAAPETSVAPLTPIEEILAAIWSEVLQREGFGPRDSFFDLGGHSLKATQVVSRARESLRVDLPVRVLFEAPTLGELAARVARQLRESGEMAVPPPVIVPREAGAPLSFAQQRLWFLDRLQPGNPAYNIPAVLVWETAPETTVLERSLAALIERHEALRTTFDSSDPDREPVQRIHPTPQVRLEVLDLRGLPAEEARAEAGWIAAALAREPFDLQRGPLLRLRLLRLAGSEARLLVVFHHIVADWWSLGIFVRELGALIEAFETGAADPLPPLPVQYADFAAWQREWLQGERLEAQLAWWRGRLAGVPPLELPTDRPRPARRTYRGGSRPFVLPAEVAERLEAVSRAEGATRFMVLMAVFQALLGRYARQADFAVGTPIANRNQPWIEGLIGFFVNTLALRADLTGLPSFRDLLCRVRDNALGAYTHQDLPFERLVEELAPQRDLSHPPLFQVLLTFQNEATVGGGPGLPIRLEGLSLDTAKLDLTLALGDGPDGLEGYLEHNADLFDVATVERMVGHFRRLLEEALAAPAEPVEELPLLSAAERDQLRVWTGVPASDPASCVHERFAEHAARHPEAPALVFEAERWTYGHLEARANRLARHLRAAGVGPESRVGLFLERSAETVLTLLATLKAGGAYVPLDPAYPRERLASLLADAGVEVVITREPLLPRLPETVGAVVCLDRDAAQIACRNGAPLTAPWLDHLAYVLFTSGSTGRPKAVAIGHRQLAGYVAGVLSRIDLPEGSSWATVSTFSADLGNTSVFPSLCTGGCLHVVAEARTTDPVRFAEYFRRERIDCLKIVPSHLAALQTGSDPAGVLPAKRLVMGGEALSWEMVSGLRALAPGLGILNHYGPTETTVGVLTCVVEEPRAGASVPLGRPLPGVRIRILDPRLQPAPLGVPGELCLGGPSLARGYLGRPDQTAERFLPDPFSDEPGERLYRTGDRARFLKDGLVEFLGRVDHQVKIRGFRVEPGEIEAALERRAGVRAAVVLPRNGADGSLQLAAWVAGERLLSASGLRESLRAELPPHMIPAEIVLLDALPITPNGKVDRRALAAAAVETASAPAETAPALPMSGLAGQIAGLWRELLNVERVGLDDNFFDLGGHSLLLIRLQGRLRRDMGLDVPVVDLFRFPTVSALAAHLGDAPEASPAPLAPAPRALSGRSDIAVIGVSGRFPGARSAQELWDNLCAGVETVTRFGEPEEVGPGRRHVPARGILQDVDLFDADFFGVRPREAELLDPQHRLFLECCWEALESGGYDPARYAGAIGVWAGVGRSWYYLSQIHGGPDAEDPSAHFGNDKDFLPTRISYKLGLRGPSLSVQSSCSSSLVAIHLACRALAVGECDMALAGGARIVVPQEQGYVYEEGGIASPDGHCRAFDADAQGVVPGNGVGVVLLKRLADAVADGDEVLAIIKGSAINNDGSDKVGYTAPSVDGQVRVLAAAQAAAGVTPDQISYIEAHGTGTALGDPIEVAALKLVFAGSSNRCALGALKTNVGHLDAAAGIAGLIKTVYALRERRIPPTLHFRRPNPELGLEASPFFVNSGLLPWESDGPRRAGVSSFGIGGTNAHVVLEEAPAAPPSGSSRRWQLMTLSARSGAALARAAENLAAHLESHPDADLADVAWTLHVGRRAFPRRRIVIAGDALEAAAALRAVSREGGGAEVSAASVVFLFPGQGSQRAGMAGDLYREEPVFRAEIDRAARLLRGRLGIDLLELLDPPAGAEEAADARLRRTDLTQPALFAVEHALARLWMSWGIRPAAMIGHSVGEYVAACLAGVFSFEDALELVAERGRLMAELPQGAMLAVPLPENEIRDRLRDGLSLAAVNGAASCVVAGPAEAIEALRARLLAEGVETRRLRVSHAFHSAMMDPVLDRFAAAVARVERRAPVLPWVSNVTGGWIHAGEAVDPGYWARHLRATVRFYDGLETLLAEPGRVVLEVGPGEALSRFARRHPAAAGRPVLASLPRREDGASGQRSLLEALGGLWTTGIEPDWTAFHAGERRRRVPLPTYPFERRRYWAEPLASRLPSLDSLATTGGAAIVLLALPAGSPTVAPAGWTAEPLQDPIPAELAAAFGSTAPADARFVLLRPAAPAEAPVESGLPAEDAPRDDTEATLAVIWQEAFGIARIGVHDGFFALGGDSLLATQIVAHVRAKLGREVSLSAFLEAGTIACLADVCRSTPAAPPAADFGQILANLENLSIEELEALLATQASDSELNERGLP